MPASPSAIKQDIQQFKFKKLLIEDLGWDNSTQNLDVSVQGIDYHLEGIAAKAGHGVYLISTEKILGNALRCAIERAVTKVQAKHLLIFTDTGRTTQIWQHAERVRGDNHAIRTRYHDHTYENGGSGERLAQVLQELAISLAEEATLTGVDVDAKREALNVEKVTKKFYDRFKKQHEKLVNQITGMDDNEKPEYALLMLNRLMFTYFIQKKSFLGNDINYLRTKLNAISGKVGFYTFYQHFLLKFFHHGLGGRKENRSAEIKTLIGDVPYLNGGLFEAHRIELQYAPTLDIPDEAFRSIFDLFDEYQWHLDTRETRNDNEINPDVLGYIFEKYINQKQMGAYYTKEDITEYISKNTIIPFLFNRAYEGCQIAFSPTGPVWSLLKDDPDRYIYPAVRHGVIRSVEDTDGAQERRYIPLPENIAAGISNVSMRQGWNAAAPEDYGLPTETWREHIARRQRYDEVYEKLSRGEITQINDLITYNLDIILFARDAIQNAEGADLVKAFYEAITGITVLDPTCGSGAFLFAALNILEPLYEACLDRMAAFIEEDNARMERENTDKERHLQFRGWLQAMSAHTGAGKKTDRDKQRRYYIYKSIIINNLYGVDIMDEATEIAKLRLFLKLVSQVDSAQHVEPLPDIDFNIRTGNTLIGYINYEEIQHAVGSRMDFDNTMDRIKEKAEQLSRAMDRFREQQIEIGGKITIDDKRSLYSRMHDLDNELDRYLATEYGIEPTNTNAFEAWKSSHQPFHWYTHFFSIMHTGGFDVIIGNPPYVSVSEISYGLDQVFDKHKYSDLYAYTSDRGLSLIHKQGHMGLIIPLSITFSRDFTDLRSKILQSGSSWFSSYDNIPAALFAGVSQRCTIWIFEKKELEYCYFTAPMYRWRSAFRPFLLYTGSYCNGTGRLNNKTLPKVGDQVQFKLISAIHNDSLTNSKNIRYIANDTSTTDRIGFSQAARNFVSIFLEEPPCIDESSLLPTSTSKIGYIKLKNNVISLAALAILSTDIFFLYWLIIGDGFDVTSGVVSAFLMVLNKIDNHYFDVLTQIGQTIHNNRYSALSFKKNAGKYVGNFNYRKISHLTKRAELILLAALNFDKTMVVHTFEYVQHVLSVNEYAGEKGIPSTVKALYLPQETNSNSSDFDEIDRALAQHYGFTDEELDFIINYDIKYRMGQDADDGGDDE